MRTGFCLFVVLAVLLPGCDDAEEPVVRDPALHRSGTRLRARVRVAEGGASVFLGWMDTLLDVPCFFRATSAGVRCIPESVGATYRDSGCLAPALVVGACSKPPAFVTYRFSRGATCAGRAQEASFEVLRVGGPIQQSVAFSPGSECQASLVPLGGRLLELSPVDPTTFVGATVLVEDRDDRLAVRVYLGDDGSREVAEVIDRASAEVCEPREATGSVGVCAPADVAYQETTGYFRDADCLHPLAQQAASPPCPRARVIVAQPELCGPHRLLALGAWVPSSDVFVRDGQCGALPMSDPSFGNVFYELGEPVPPGTFPPLAFGRSGTGRLAVGTVTTSSGVALRADPWFVDTDRGISCTAEAFADGAVRCVPGSTPGILRGGASEVFADDACTRPITRVYASPCASYAPREAVVYTADACGVTTASSVHLLGAPFAGDAVYWWKDGACAVSPYPVTGHFEIGAEVDPSVFASIDEGIELPGRRRPGARSHGRHPSPRAGRLPGAARRQLHATALHPLGRRGERAGSAGVALNPRWKRRCRVDAPPGTPAA